MSPAVIALFFTLAGIWYLGCKKYLNADQSKKIEIVKMLIRNVNEIFFSLLFTEDVR